MDKHWLETLHSMARGSQMCPARILDEPAEHNLIHSPIHLGTQAAQKQPEHQTARWKNWGSLAFPAMNTREKTEVGPLANAHPQMFHPWTAVLLTSLVQVED